MMSSTQYSATVHNTLQSKCPAQCCGEPSVLLPSVLLASALLSNTAQCSTAQCCPVFCCPVFCCPVSWECISQIALLSAAVTSFTNTSRPLGGGALQTPMQRVETEKGPKINLREKKLQPSWKSLADKQTKSSSCIDRSGTRRKYWKAILVKGSSNTFGLLLSNLAIGQQNFVAWQKEITFPLRPGSCHELHGMTPSQLFLN